MAKQSSFECALMLSFRVCMNFIESIFPVKCSQCSRLPRKPKACSVHQCALRFFRLFATPQAFSQSLLHEGHLDAGVPPPSEPGVQPCPPLLLVIMEEKMKSESTLKYSYLISHAVQPTGVQDSLSFCTCQCRFLRKLVE